MQPRKPGRWKPPSARQASNGRAERSRSAPRSVLRCWGRPTNSPTCSPGPTTPCTRARRRGKAAGYHRCVSKIGFSRNDIRRELILDKGHPVLQVQLALFQPLDLQNIGTGRRFERSDRSIEVAVLLQEARQLVAKLAFFLFGHGLQQFHPPAAARRRRNPNKYPALRMRHQDGMMSRNGADYGDLTRRTTTGRRLAGSLLSKCSGQESHKGGFLDVHPIASCGTGKKASGARD